MNEEGLDMEHIGASIVALRRARDWDQATLARAAGTSPRYIDHIEKGRKHPGVKTLQGLSRAFQITIDDLLAGCQS